MLEAPATAWHPGQFVGLTLHPWCPPARHCPCTSRGPRRSQWRNLTTRPTRKKRPAGQPSEPHMGRSSGDGGQRGTANPCATGCSLERSCTQLPCWLGSFFGKEGMAGCPMRRGRGIGFLHGSRQGRCSKIATATSEGGGRLHDWLCQWRQLLCVPPSYGALYREPWLLLTTWSPSSEERWRGYFRRFVIR